MARLRNLSYEECIVVEICEGTTMNMSRWILFSGLVVGCSGESDDTPGVCVDREQKKWMESVYH